MPQRVLPADTTEEEGCNAFSRRTFLKTTALLGSTAAFAHAVEVIKRAEAEGEYPLMKPEGMIFTVCQQCNTQCGIKVKLMDGVAVKIDGNPYSPWTLCPHLSYKTPLRQAAVIDGSLCPKGQAGLQTAYDPYRLRVVLKRKPGTKRGENQWVTIPFEQAIREIVEGGDLFGEGHVQGLRELWALRDPKVMAAMGEFVKRLWAEKDKAKKKALVDGFKRQFADHLHTLIDPDHPDLGPKNNQVVFMWGRLKAGRGDFISRFIKDGFGSVNAHGHTTVCQGSLYFAGKAMSEQFVEGKFSGGAKFYWQADLLGSEFVIFVGSSPFEANYGPPYRTNKITEGIVSGRLKYAVIDPRFSKTAAKAKKWLPNKPGTEGAIAMAMVRWIIENHRYDEVYLRNANKAAAKAVAEPTWTNAVWLVKIGDDGTPGAFLRASEIGLTTKREVAKDDKKVTVYLTPDGKELTYDLLVTLVDGKPVAFDPNDETNPVVGDLFVDTTLKGTDDKPIRVKSALQILKESAEKMTLEQYAAEAGLKVSDIIALADEFTSHGKRAAVDIHRGVSQHTNGFYNVTAWFTLCLLIGNYDWQGGMVKVATYDHTGSKAGKPFDLTKLNPGKLSPFGVSIIRHETKYEDTTLFDGYPAKRHWYPLASDIYQEIVPSIGDAYPYPVKALFIYMGSPVYALPAGHTNIEILRDPKKIPLVIAIDIVVGETSMYADYIFPDLTYLERWEFSGSHPSVVWKAQPVRQPAIAPLTETVKVFGQEMPICLESVLLGIAEALGLPNFGPNGFGDGQPFTHPDHFYLRMVANLAFGERPDGSDAVPDASDEEVHIFLEARKHLPKSVFDPDRWKSVVGEDLWRKVVYVLNRGGRFEDFEKAFVGEQVKNKYGALVNLYQEKTATTKHAMTGKPLLGYATYIPAPMDFEGRLIKDDESEFPFKLITYREITMTKSRTVADYWLLGVAPENFVLMNERDATRLGLKDGDLVKIVSPTNPEGVWPLGDGRAKEMVGKVKVIQGILPGVIAFSLGYGHWAYGSSDFVIDGELVKGDPRRATGIHANAAMRTDPVVTNTCLTDPVGASAVFYDTRVKVVKV